MSRIPTELRAEVDKWRNFPRERPENIPRPAAGQESVWDYPRPPRVETVARRIQVFFGGVLIADSVRTNRVLETSSPPVYYIPQGDIQMQYLEAGDQNALCEWKGVSQYWSLRVGDRLARNAAWLYEAPWEGFEAIAGALAFNASKMDRCTVDGEVVSPQPGNYYGGWITAGILGPFKGSPGSERW